MDLIPGLGRSPGKGNGNPLQYSFWETPWTEKFGPTRFYRSYQKSTVLPDWGCKRVGHDLVTKWQQFLLH